MNPTSTYPKLLDNKFYFVIDPWSNCHTDKRLLEGDICINMQDPLTGRIQPWRGKRLLINKSELHSIKKRVFYEGDIIELEKCFIIKNIKPQEVKTWKGGFVNSSNTYPRTCRVIAEGLQTRNIYQPPVVESIWTGDIATDYTIDDELQSKIEYVKEKYDIDLLKKFDEVDDEYQNDPLEDYRLEYTSLYFTGRMRLHFRFTKNLLSIYKKEIETIDMGKIPCYNFLTKDSKTFNITTSDYSDFTEEEYNTFLCEDGTLAKDKYPKEELKTAVVELENKKYKVYCYTYHYDDTDDYSTDSKVLRLEEL